jgi:hypothetical protein
MSPVYSTSKNMKNAAEILFSKEVLNDCSKMVERQKPLLFMLLQNEYEGENLKKGRNGAWAVPIQLLPTNYMTWPIVFIINENSQLTPQVPTFKRPLEAKQYILDTYDLDHQNYCLSLAEREKNIQNKAYYSLCNDGKCKSCLRCRQWWKVYRLWDALLTKEYRDNLRLFFSEYYLPTFFLFISQEVRRQIPIPSLCRVIKSQVCHHEHNTEEKWMNYLETISPGGYDISLYSLLIKIDGPIRLSKKNWSKLMDRGK